MKIEYLDTVVLNREIPEEYLQKGAIGTVVEVFSDDFFLVEFADKFGQTYAMVELEPADLVKVVREPLAMAA